MRNTIFPEIVNQMKIRNEKVKDLATLLGIANSQATRRLSGKVEWTIGDIEILCKHYNTNFYELFKRKES